MPNPITFFEIVGPDSAALQRFYGTVFGWEVDSTRVPGYAYLSSGVEGSISGGIRQETEAPAERILYFETENLAAALERVTAAGGSVVLPPTRLPWVHFALFRDPGGNLTGLIAR